MILFSTILDVKPSLTKQAFIALIEEWNATQSHKENIIPDMKWNGQPESEYGNDTLFMQILDQVDLSTVAVRYEKHSGDGAIWDTDYIFNYGEGKLAILLSRSYAEIQLGVDPSFSTPHFITLLIDKGYLKDDGNLPMERIPLELTEERIPIFVNLRKNTGNYRFPVVFVSKTHDNKDPVDVNLISARLKGIAHVLVQPDVDQALILRSVCDGQEEYFGYVGIYLPNGGHQRLRYAVISGYDPKLYEDIIYTVMHYANVQALPQMYTWQGIRRSMTLKTMDHLITEAQQAQKQAEDDKDEFVNSFDDDISRLRRRIDELTRDVESKENELRGYRNQVANYKAQPVLFHGEEHNLYPDEVKDILLATLDGALQNMDPESRRYHIVADIIAHNDYQELAEGRRKKLKNLLCGYRVMSAKVEEGLKELGFEVTEDGKHYKLRYYDDSRYWSALPKSGSDGRGGQNAASDIAKHMF